MSQSCETVQHAIRDAALTEDQRAHIDGCAACARFELEQRAPAPSASEPSLDALFDQLQAHVEADSDWRGALRSLPRNTRAESEMVSVVSNQEDLVNERLSA